MSVRGLLAKHNALKPRVYQARFCVWPCAWHAEHQDGSVSHCSDFSTALSAALNYRAPDSGREADQ